MQRLIKDIILERAEDGPIRMEAHHLNDGELDRQLKLAPFDKAPVTLVAVFFGVEDQWNDKSSGLIR